MAGDFDSCGIGLEGMPIMGIKFHHFMDGHLSDEQTKIPWQRDSLPIEFASLLREVTIRTDIFRLVGIIDKGATGTAGGAHISILCSDTATDRKPHIGLIT